MLDCVQVGAHGSSKILLIIITGKEHVVVEDALIIKPRLQHFQMSGAGSTSCCLT
jgi:hypothetical protein